MMILIPDLKQRRLACARATLPAVLACLLTSSVAFGQFDPASFVQVVPITDNNPATNELGRDRVSINSTPFKNQSMYTVGNYQFVPYFRDDGKLLIARRDLTAATNHWDIRATEFTSFNINDAHNVPVLGIDGNGIMHLSWGMHAHNLLYTRSTAPVTSGGPLSFVGDTVGNSAAINTMTGQFETQVTYPNFLNVPNSDNLLFNYRTGGSGNGTYRISQYDAARDVWSFTDERWIENTDPSGRTYNAYPHNMTYDSQGGLHASWTFRYNSSSPTGNSGFQTNHNLMYGYSPDNGLTWYRDIDGTIPYVGAINDVTSEVIVPIPEGSSLINTGTQAIDIHDRPAIATWWAPRAQDATPDHDRQYMYVGHNGSDWFTSQITHRRSDNLSAPIPESQLGVHHMGRPQIVFDDYNRAYVIYKDADRGGVVTVAVSQAESRDDWELIDLTSTDLGRNEPTIDLGLWEQSRKLHILTQTIDGNSSNGGSQMEIVEWDAASAMGRVLRWSGGVSSTWNTTEANFKDLGTPDSFDSFDHVTFDDSGDHTSIQFAGNVQAGKVVVDSIQAYTFSGPGAMTSGSLALVGGGSLELATSGNSYSGPTRVSNATLRISGDANAMTSTIIAADGGTVIMDPTDAANMTSSFDIWPTGTLQIGTATSTGNVFPNNPASILNDGHIRVMTTAALKNVTGNGTIEVAGGATTLTNNESFAGSLRVRAGAAALVGSADGLGPSASGVTVEGGGALHVEASHSFDQAFQLEGVGNATIHVADAKTMTINRPVAGPAGLIKEGAGTLKLQGDNVYAGTTVVRDGLLVIDQSTGSGETIVEAGGTLQAGGSVRGDLTVGGGGVLRIASSAATSSGVLFREDFLGPGGSLNGTLPDVSFSGATWIAAPTFKDNGLSVAGPAGGSATLAFTPADGATYVLETSLENITGDTDWFGLGFANGQSSVNSGNTRFITGDVVGLAWAMYRGSQVSSTNSTFLGDKSHTSGGILDGAAWLNDAMQAGGSVDLRITLDTTGGAGSWTAMMEADTGSGFKLIRAAELLNDQSINSIGIANSNTADLTGKITAFSLSTVVPSPSPLATRTLSIEGEVFLESGALLQMQIAGPNDHDVLEVANVLHASGALEVALEAGGSPLAAGDSFNLLEFNALTGAFDLLALPPLSHGLVWDNSQLLVDGVITVAAGLQGDYNGDGSVDVADYTVWRDSLGASGAGLIADGNRDLRVDQLDYVLWKSKYGGVLSSASVATANVPEPSTGAILLLLALPLAARYPLAPWT